MNKLSKGSSEQVAFGEFSNGSVVKLDGGKRLRLDDKVDFWPATGTWRVLETGEDGRGPTAMFAYLAAQRAKAGNPVPEPVPVATLRRISCNYCGQPAGLFGGRDVYPHRKDLAHRNFWVCWLCNAWVGCHDREERDEPMGLLADEPLRDARVAAHEAFDPIWRDGQMSKAAAYEWLAEATGIPPLRCRIGWMEQAECRRVVDAVLARGGPAL